jgi:hypothetical protein
MLHSEAFVRGTGFSRVTFGLPFAAAGHAVMAGPRLMVGFSRDSVVVVHDILHEAIDTLKIGIQARPIAREDWDARWDTLVANAAPEFRERMALAKGDVLVFDRYPRYQRVLATPAGSLAAYVARDAERGIYELRCIQLMDGDRCPSIQTSPGEVVLAIASGVAAVAVETADGTWHIVRRSGQH